eukprot:12701203-Alexandrium_andersonii.AAC.1
MKDVEVLARECRPLIGAPPLQALDVEFADDTVLIARDSTAAQMLLNLLEAEASGYGLRINKDKTAHMSLNSAARISFASGEPVPKQVTVKYLGVIIEANGGHTAEVAARLKSAATAFAMLRPLWKSRAVTLKHK